jgi:hypothetical protein
VSRYSNLSYFATSDRLPLLSIARETLLLFPAPFFRYAFGSSGTFFLPFFFRGSAITAEFDRVGHCYFILRNLISSVHTRAPHRAREHYFPSQLVDCTLHLAALHHPRGSISYRSRKTPSAFSFPSRPFLSRCLSVCYCRYPDQSLPLGPFPHFTFPSWKRLCLPSPRGSEGPLPLCQLNTRRRRHQAINFGFSLPTAPEHCFRSLAVPASPNRTFFLQPFFSLVFPRAFIINADFPTALSINHVRISFGRFF